MRDTLIFELDGRTVCLRTGEIVSRFNSVTYADTTDDNVGCVEKAVADGEPWRDAVHRVILPVSAWLDRCITYPDRDLFLRRIDIAPTDRVLDVGSGWGQLAIPLAHRAKVCSLEPSRSKTRLQQAIARQEGVVDDLWLVNAAYQGVRFCQPFQVAILNGVLEWVGQFSSDDPYAAQISFLEKILGDLVPGGQLVIGIENRIGLKYLLGAVDDHTGVPMVSVYDRQLAATKFEAHTGHSLRTFTYTLAEYESMLARAGFEAAECFAAFPDYKLPAAIFPARDPSAVNDFLLSGNPIPEHSGYDGNLLPLQPELQSLYRSLAELKIAQYFAPSYYIVARRPALTPSAAPALCNLDQLNDEEQPARLERVVTTAGSEMVLRGWAADGSVESPAGGVQAVLDGIPYNAAYGLERPDVATAFGRSAYARTGFEISIPGTLVKPGAHELKIRVVSASRKTFAEASPLLIDSC